MKRHRNVVRNARRKETVIPQQGDWGGPLCRVLALYEDGTEISFGHSIMSSVIPRPDPEVARKAVEDLLLFRNREWQAIGVAYQRECSIDTEKKKTALLKLLGVK